MQTVEYQLTAFLSGRVNASDTKRALLDQFAVPQTLKHKEIIRQYIDELVAEIESGDVSLESATEGLEESIAASFALSKSTFD